MNVWISVALAAVAALIICLAFYGQMKSVASRKDAMEYIKGTLHLTGKSDVFTHTTKTVTRIGGTEGPGHGPGPGRQPGSRM